MNHNIVRGIFTLDVDQTSPRISLATKRQVLSYPSIPIQSIETDAYKEKPDEILKKLNFRLNYSSGKEGEV